MQLRIFLLLAAVVGLITALAFWANPTAVSASKPPFSAERVGDEPADPLVRAAAASSKREASAPRLEGDQGNIDQGQLHRVFQLQSAAESGDLDAYLELDSLLKLCAIVRPTSQVAIKAPPEQSPMRAPWLAMRDDIQNTCMPLRLEQFDLRKWWELGDRLRKAAWSAGDARLGMPGPVPSLHSGRPEDVDRLTDSWGRAALAKSPQALESALSAAIPYKGEAALPYLQEALDRAGVESIDPVLQHLKTLGPPLAACQKFGRCQLPAEFHARLCIYMHACFGDLPLPELLNGRVMSSADYYKLQAIVTALLAQLDRPGG